MKQRPGITIAELLISMLIFSIFLIILFASLTIVINTMETQDMIVSKLYTAAKINFLFGILEDEFKWMGSFGKGLVDIGGAFDIDNSKGIKATPDGTDVTLDYQYAVIENFVLQKKEGTLYEKVFLDATNPEADDKYYVILSDEQMNSASTETLDVEDVVIDTSATESTVTITPSQDATRIYFVRIRDGNDDTKPIDENGNPDHLEQFVRGKLTYDHEAKAIYLNTQKGFSAFNATMTIVDGVELFQLAFYDGDWKTPDQTPDYEHVTAIQATITVNIPVSRSIKERCEEDNPDLIRLTKNRVFWLPPDESLN